MTDGWLSPAGASELLRAQQQVEQRRSTGRRPLPPGIHPCPTCGPIGCERCLGLGRQQWARVTASDSHDGRATIEIWFGPGGTMELVATNQQTLAHDRVDLLLATLNEAPGVLVRDRRAAR